MCDRLFCLDSGWYIKPFVSGYLSGRLLGTNKICPHSSYCADICLHSTYTERIHVHIVPTKWTYVHVVSNEQ